MDIDELSYDERTVFVTALLKKYGKVSSNSVLTSAEKELLSHYEKQSPRKRLLFLESLFAELVPRLISLANKVD